MFKTEQDINMNRHSNCRPKYISLPECNCGGGKLNDTNVKEKHMGRVKSRCEGKFENGMSMRDTLIEASININNQGECKGN